MKKIFHKCYYIYFSIFFMFISLFSTAVKAEAGVFITNSCHVNIVANRDNSFEFTEEYQLDFVEASHGILVYLPEFSNSAYKLDHGLFSSLTQLKYTNIRVIGDDYKTYNKDGNIYIKIGNKDRFVKGPKKYIIKYKMTVMSNSENTFNDVLYLNLKHPKWGSSIANYSFNLTMPKPINEKSIQIYSGNQIGVTDNEYIHYEVSRDSKKTVISGEGEDLPQNSVVTIFSELDKNYFNLASLNIIYAGIFIIFTALIIFVIAILLFKKYGRNPEIIKIIEFYPPDNMTPLEISAILNKPIDKKDLTANIIYLASLGYLKIGYEDGVKPKKFKPKKMILEKVANQNITRLPSYLQDLYNSLFSSESSMLLGDYDPSEFASMLESLKGYSPIVLKTPIKDKSASRYKILTFFLLELSIVINTLVLPWFFNVYSHSINYYFIIGVASLIAFLFIQKAVKKEVYVKWKFYLYNLLAVLSMLFAIYLIRNYRLMFIANLIYLAILTISIFLVGYMDNITKDGALLLGRVLGFKEFLKTAEEDKIKALVQDDPYYFFNILPYTYVFGINDVWMKKLNEAIVPKNWSEQGYFVGIDVFDILYMSHFANGINHCVSTIINEHTQSSIADEVGSFLSGSGSGGGSFGSGGSGGFGGGGFGGGGSSSW